MPAARGAGRARVAARRRTLTQLLAMAAQHLVRLDRPRERGGKLGCHGVPLSTFLFDHDGTLIDSIELILRSYRHTMRLHRGHEPPDDVRSEEHTSELQSLAYLVCRLLLEKKKN